MEELIATHIDKYKDNLESLGFKVSTGSVVPFRAKQFLDNGLTEFDGSVPLIWMQNIADGSVSWPIDIANKSIKIKVTNESKKILIQNKNYIFLKRLSSKGGKRHMNSAVYFKNYLDFEFIGVENHVNYIRKKKGELTENESHGIVALLNSIIYNKYFQIGNGTTQVNAREISDIPLPPINLVKKLGDSIIELKQRVGKIENSTQEKMIAMVLNIDEQILKDLGSS